MSYHASPDGTSIHCDRIPPCPARVHVPAHGWPAHKQAVRLAEQEGWQIGPYSEHPIDFCPEHVDLERPHGAVRKGSK